MATKQPHDATRSSDEPRKKRAKKEILVQIPTKLPIPPQKDSDKQSRVAAQKEASVRRKLSHDQLPSICMYTIFNANELHNSAALCSTITEDSSMIAIGFSDSTIKVWALNTNNLKKLRPPEQLEELDKEAEDITQRMMDDDKGEDRRVLVAHSGPVYGVSFSPCKSYLLSCSEDGTVRLWSLLTWTNVCVYRGHCNPVWDVKFAPHGYYFATCSIDRTARIWATEHHHPLRIFVGHEDDIDLVEFHPSSNILATGSIDKTIMLWDIFDGTPLKALTGHTDRITAMTFSNDGKFLISCSADRHFIVWEHHLGHKLADFELDTNAMSSLAFSRCGVILSSATLDDKVYIWDFSRLLEEMDTDDLNDCSTPKVYTNARAVLLATYRTKATSVLDLSFSRRNLLLATGAIR